MFAGLSELGISNGDDLKETLTNCTEPLKAIDQFQMENGILLPTLQSALPFLDLHGTPRLEFHQSVFDELRDKLMERVAVIADGKEEDRYGKLEELLEKSFPLVKMPSIQPVVMQVLKHLPKVPEKKLKLVMADKELYKVCAVEVKRQIWQDNQALFGDEVSPLLKQYIVEKEAALFSSDLSILHNFFSPSPKTRRQGEVVLKLTHMIGKNVKLYDMVLQFLRTLFLRTRNVHYCTLRAELLMSLHDLDISEICSVDPCHKFTWCLDACIREKFVDGKRARELQGFLDGVKKGQEQVLGDLSMILCDPFACNTLALSIMRNLQELLSQESLPRDSPDLMLLLRMLSLGQGAWDMIDSQVFKEPRLVEVVTRFLPAMMSVVVDDHTFTVEQKLPNEEKSSLTYPIGLPDAFSRYLLNNRVACEMGLYYVLHIAKLRNKNALQRLLPALVDSYNDMAFSDIFLHLLTGHLTLLSDEFGSGDFCSVVFDGFLLTSFSRFGCLVLILSCCSEPLKELYTQLTEKLEAHKKSPPPLEKSPSLDMGLHPVAVTQNASVPTTSV
uniref:Negative elongation factor complex member B n=1 Tax=Oryzias latipes TaxID=8090 RepID=A0A3P9JEN4_ORYLA